MSDEFIRVATQEINEELSGIRTILGSCLNDSDVSKNSQQIEAHMHKIKGLAPMMGKENVGHLAKTLDAILKKIVAGNNVDGFFNPLVSSIEQMTLSMEKSYDLTTIHKQVSDIATKIAD